MPAWTLPSGCRAALLHKVASLNVIVSGPHESVVGTLRTIQLRPHLSAFGPKWTWADFCLGTVCPLMTQSGHELRQNILWHICHKLASPLRNIEPPAQEALAKTSASKNVEAVIGRQFRRPY